MSLIEAYYAVAKDLSFRASEMNRAADMIFQMADKMAEENARACAEFNAAQPEADRKPGYANDPAYQKDAESRN